MDTPTLVIPGIDDPVTLAVIARSRTFIQYLKMVGDALAKRCAFCQIDRTYNLIILENDFWYAWHSKPPEKNTRLHFLYVPKRHVTDSEQLSDEEVLAVFGSQGIRRQVREMHGYTSRGTLMRDGDARLSAGTIEHLHIHDMVPSGKGRVESPFHKGFEEERAGHMRAIIFEKMRQGISVDELSEEDRRLVEGRI